jgi:hypothetical protein
MLKVVRTAALLLLTVMPSSAYAASCEGQKGKVIFEDDFSDDSGGWPADPDAKFGKSGLALRIQDPSTNWPFWSRTFAAAEGDFCVEAVLPTVAAGDVSTRTGLTFLINDANNLYLLLISNNAVIQLHRKEAGNWTNLGEFSDAKLKPEPGSIVALRTVVKANLITTSVNGIETKKLRAQLPGGNPKFGVYVQSDKTLPAPGATFEFKKYKVTAGE